MSDNVIPFPVRGRAPRDDSTVRVTIPAREHVHMDLLLPYDLAIEVGRLLDAATGSICVR